MEVAHQVVLMSSPGFTRTTATVAPANTGVLTFYHAAPHFLLGALLAADERCTTHADCVTGFCHDSLIEAQCTGDGCSASPAVGTRNVPCPPGCTASTTLVNELTGWAAAEPFAGFCQNWPLFDTSTCSDGELTVGTELGVDCGGECSEKCPIGTQCFQDSDCVSSICWRTEPLDYYTGTCSSCA